MGKRRERTARRETIESIIGMAVCVMLSKQDRVSVPQLIGHLRDAELRMRDDDAQASLVLFEAISMLEATRENRLGTPRPE